MSFATRLSITSIVCLSLGSPLFPVDPDRPNIEGRHPIVAIERNGRQFDEGIFRGAVFRFTEDKVLGINLDGTEFLTADYGLNTIRKPCTIVLRLTDGANKGVEMRGMIDRKENTIRMILANPGTDRPTEFRTKENQTMFTMRAEK